MKICAVTVTYGSRATGCLKISENALLAGIDHLIIINNGSVPESLDQLKRFSDGHSNVQLISMEKNMGSAAGFGRGISAFLLSACDFILLLDDDNMLAPGALANMISTWEGIDTVGKEESTALAAFRQDRPNMNAALQAGNPDYILPMKNSFMGFHIRLIGQFIRQRIKPAKMSEGTGKRFLDIPATTYGGLWMHRQLCEKIGLPDTDYVLYMDDFAFTRRIPALKGRIILLRDSPVQDLQESYYLPAKKKWLYHSLLYASTDAITYYTCRNIVFFCKKHGVTHAFVYGLNRLLYFVAVFFLAVLTNKLNRLKIIYRAVSDAEWHRMGFNPRFPLS